MLFLHKMRNLNPIMRIRQTQNEEYSAKCHNWPVIFKNIKDTKGRERLRNCSRLKENEERTNEQTCDSELDTVAINDFPRTVDKI